MFKKSNVEQVAKVAAPPTKIKNIDLIKKHEGLRLEAYLPTPNDRWTIGYGHTKTVYRGMKIDIKRAEELLRSDVAWVERTILDSVKAPLTQNQFDALASLVYNIGAGAFKKSSVLRRLNDEDYKGAADAFLMWTKQKNKTTGKMDVLRGLVRRREEEREWFLK